MNNATSQHLREWKVLCWNVRGLNLDRKWNSIRDKMESQCDVVCLQETKKESFDSTFIKNFCPLAFDEFLYLPSIGASGGLITIWKSAQFEGHLEFMNEYSVSVSFKSTFNNAEWTLDKYLWSKHD